MTAARAGWDAATRSLLVQAFTTPTNPVTVNVRWGAENLISDTQYQYFIIPVNNSDQDKPYIVHNTSGARDHCRYTEGDAELVYRFDISDYQSSLFALSLCSNYLIEASPDGENWTTVVDFSAESPVRAVASNPATRVINPADFDITDEIYIRMRNTDPAGGWGGTLSQITVQYLR